MITGFVYLLVHYDFGPREVRGVYRSKAEARRHLFTRTPNGKVSKSMSAHRSDCCKIEAWPVL